MFSSIARADAEPVVAEVRKVPARFRARDHPRVAGHAGKQRERGHRCDGGAGGLKPRRGECGRGRARGGLRTVEDGTRQGIRRYFSPRLRRRSSSCSRPAHSDRSGSLAAYPSLADADLRSGGIDSDPEASQCPVPDHRVRAGRERRHGVVRDRAQHRIGHYVHS